MRLSSRRTIPQMLLGLSLCCAMPVVFAADSSDVKGADASANPTNGTRRLTQAQYRRSIADIFGSDIRIVGRMEPDIRLDGLIAIGSGAASVTPSALERYDEIARSVAEQVTDETHRARLIGCGPTPQDANGVRCAQSFFERVGLRIYRRPLTSSESARLAAVAVSGGRQLGSFYAGVSAVLAGMMASPEGIFCIDVPDRSGISIDGYSKASRLSYLLWNTTPDPELLDAAARGSLDSDAGLAQQVDRLIASSRFKEGMDAFFTDFLQLDDFETVSKDGVIYPAFSTSVASALREQTLRTIADLLITHEGDYRDLFTSRRLAMTRILGPIYRVPVATTDWSMHEFPENDPRVGLLTEAGLLALHSHPGRTSPTLRGKSVRETLLCQPIPSPPANVNFAVVQDVNNPTLRTTRARLQAHLDDEECASCHKRMDPIGLGLENFDGVGQFRSSEHGEAIDASGEFDKTHFANAAALGQLFHDDPRVPACFVTTAWRYATSRSGGESEQKVLNSLQSSFSAAGYRVVQLMRQIALNPALYAWPSRIRAANRAAVHALPPIKEPT